MPIKRLTRICLAPAIALPVIYFAGQLAAAPFYPHYSFNRQVASWLGSGNSTQPWIFNLGLLLSGISAIVGAYGLFAAFRRSAGVGWSLLVGIAALVIGATTFKSGVYPFPDPRHNSWGVLTVGIILMPLLLLIASWRAHLSATLRCYLAFSSALVLALVPFMSGILSVSSPGKGTFQRLFVIATFVPIAITAYALRSRAPANASFGVKPPQPLPNSPTLTKQTR